MNNPIFCSAGKTLLAKAVANQTSATFLRVCGSELIQKYLVCVCVIVESICLDSHMIDACMCRWALLLCICSTVECRYIYMGLK